MPARRTGIGSMPGALGPRGPEGAAQLGYLVPHLIAPKQ
jgi:hypothetical protein